MELGWIICCVAILGAAVAAVMAVRANARAAAARLQARQLEERVADERRRADELVETERRHSQEALERQAEAHRQAMDGQTEAHRQALESQAATYRQALERQKADFDAANAAAEERFAQLAAKALANNAESLRQQSRNSLGEVLKPVVDDMEKFRATITEYYTREAGERTSLGKSVADLMQLNATVSRETRRLTDALKGNSRMQGDWGELILDNILEQSGMRRGYEYTVQETITDDAGHRLRPDVVIHYTEGRNIIIDSKVSIQDYVNMLNAETDEQRKLYGTAHVASVKKHVAELRRKCYQDNIDGDAFDYVLMFIPHEGAYMAAMDLDNTLWQTAYDAHVLIISPTHLMSIVKLIEQMWRHDKQNRNALEIADEAGKMLDKLNGFLDDMDKIDRNLRAARDAWEAAKSKLHTGSGNLIGKALKISKLGAKARKALPPSYLPDEEKADEE